VTQMVSAERAAALRNKCLSLARPVDRFRSGEYFGTATLPSPPWNELARLNLADIDLQVGTITVRETKFFKSRNPAIS